MNLTASDVCPICNGTEFIYYTDGNGYDMAKPCECRQRNMMKRKLKFAEIPIQFKDMTLENFTLKVYQDQKSKAVAKNACNIIKAYIDNFEDVHSQGMGLYLFSNTKGSGKTRMVASIANKLIENYQVKFAVSTMILNEIRNTWNKESDYTESKLLNDLSTVDILIIDDFGTEKVVSWINDKYYHIINERYINNKVTIFTSNESLDSLKYDERITSRIMEKTYQIAFPEESVREHISKSNNADIVGRLLT